MRGDIWMYIYEGKKFFVFYFKDFVMVYGVEIVKFYMCKWEQSCMDMVKEVIFCSVLMNFVKNFKFLVCDIYYLVFGVVFSNGGYIGNFYYDFNDGFILFFIISQYLYCDVVFVIMEFYYWWLIKYIEVVQGFFKYEFVNF